MTRCAALILVTWVVLGSAQAARADVTVNPREVPAGGVARFDVRVSNDRAKTDTVQITVRLPAALTSVSFQPKARWERGVATVKLAQPFTNTEGVTVTERVDRVTWKGGKIAPGEFEEFSLIAKVPPKAGTVLAFPVLQRYADGELVRWIGSPTADRPTAQVTVGQAGDELAVGEPTTAAVVDEDDSAARANLAFLVASLGLIVGVAALVVTLVLRSRAA
jgi:uncharacterized protein YcnI